MKAALEQSIQEEEVVCKSKDLVSGEDVGKRSKP
jgi:hypothetical protein